MTIFRQRLGTKNTPQLLSLVRCNHYRSLATVIPPRVSSDVLVLETVVHNWKKVGWETSSNRTAVTIL